MNFLLQENDSYFKKQLSKLAVLEFLMTNNTWHKTMDRSTSSVLSYTKVIKIQTLKIAFSTVP